MELPIRWKKLYSFMLVMWSHACKRHLLYQVVGGSTVSRVLEVFSANGMSLDEMVTLLGAHTVGFTHCSFFRDRLNDPNMDPSLRAGLGRTCNRPNSDPRAFLDQNVSSSMVFDNAFYKQIVLRRGVLFIDQQLALDTLSKGLVTVFAGNNAAFQRSFADAVVN